MAKNILYIMLFLLASYTTKAEERIYNPETKDIVTECTENIFSDNNLSDEILAHKTDKITLCIKNAIFNQLDFLFSHDNITRQKIISKINNVETELTQIYNLSANKNKFCQSDVECGTINKYLLPASKKQMFFVDFLDLLIGLK